MMYIKYTGKQKEKSQQKTTSLFLVGTQSIYKDYHGHISIIYVLSNPIKKDMHKGGFDC